MKLIFINKYGTEVSLHSDTKEEGLQQLKEITPDINSFELKRIEEDND